MTLFQKTHQVRRACLLFVFLFTVHSFVEAESALIIKPELNKPLEATSVGLRVTLTQISVDISSSSEGFDEHIWGQLRFEKGTDVKQVFFDNGQNFTVFGFKMSVTAATRNGIVLMIYL